MFSPLAYLLEDGHLHRTVRIGAQLSVLEDLALFPEPQPVENMKLYHVSCRSGFLLGLKLSLEPICDLKSPVKCFNLSHSLSVGLALGWFPYRGDPSEHHQLWPSPELLRMHPGPRPCVCLEPPAGCMCGSCWGTPRVSVATLVSCLLP